MIINWFKTFIVQVQNNKLFTFLNVFGLSIGISCVIFALLYWNEEHSYNKWNPEKDRVFQVLCNMGNGGGIWGNNPAPVGPTMKSIDKNVTNYCYYNTYYLADLLQNKSKKVFINKIMSAQDNYFDFFPFQPIYGSAQQYRKNKKSVALELNTSKQLFGNQNPIGKRVRFGNFDFIVTFVYENQDKKSSISPEVVFNGIDQDMKENQFDWGNFNYGLLIKLKDPNKQVKSQQKINRIFYKNTTVRFAKSFGISPKEYIDKYGNTKIFFVQLNKARLDKHSVGLPEGNGNYAFLVIMFSLSILILILSIINYVNHVTANSFKRGKEIGARLANGAGKKEIIFQSIFETSILVVFSVVFSLCLVELLLPYYNQIIDKQLQIHFIEFYKELILITLITVLLAGLFPALYVSKFDLTKLLKNDFIKGKKGNWIRNGLLIFQFFIAAFFIVGSSIVNKQVTFMSEKNLGFKGDQIIQVNFSKPVYENTFDKFSTMKQELNKIKGVEGSTAGAFTFGQGGASSSSFQYNEHNIQGLNMSIDYNTFNVFDIKVIQGRNINEKLASDTVSSVLLNETALQMMGEKTPIGKKLPWNDHDFKIIGVVKDFHINGLQNEIPPMIFFHMKTVPWMQSNFQWIFIKLKANDIPATLGRIERFWKKNIEQEYPFKYEFVNKQFANSYKEYTNQKNLFSVLNMIVILIALMGLFALSSYSIERKMKEIAIRKTLGAETKDLLLILSKQYVVYCVIGFGLSIFPTYYLLSSWLENFAYRIEITLFPFIVGLILLLALSLSIVLTKAYNATRVDVLKYLRYE